MMKISSIIAGLATSLTLAASSAWAADGTVNFTGEIIDEACVVDIGADNTMTVDLGRVAKSSFRASGDEAPETRFSLKLKSCPETVTTAKVKFDGANDTTNSGLLALTQETGVAKGIGVTLRTADKAALGLDAVNDYSYTLSSTEENSLDFYAAYRSTSDTVVAGKANATYCHLYCGLQLIAAGS